MEPRDLYVYYQVADAHAAVLAERVHAMQQQLGGGRLKRRPGSADGRITMMEVYAGVGPGFAAMLEAAVATARLAELIAGTRHIEVFIDVDAMETAPCA